eukprot:m.8623 g.8623  ORF g.8623 m.8623 type:complete len:336 (-) comp3201_c0_seq1:84-1091(-)
MPLEKEDETHVDERSQGVKNMIQRLGGFESEEGRLNGLNFVPMENDVFIVTTPKAGTTWMQQICHQLRSSGSMDFEEISEVVPWIELAHDLDQDLTSSQGFPPRCFKTHCWYDHCPKGGKYIIVMRDPIDVALSFYKFFDGWFLLEEDNVSMAEFVREFWLKRGIPESPMQNASYFHHLLSWFEHFEDANVTFFFFEDMIDDLEACVRKVDAFMGLNSNEETIQTAVEKSSFSFMKDNSTKFNENLSKRKRNKHCGLPDDQGLSQSKVSSGTKGKARDILPPDIVLEIDKKWKDLVEPVTGCASYTDFRKKNSNDHLPPPTKIQTNQTPNQLDEV